MYEDVARYVKNCGTYTRAKSLRDKYYSLLRPLDAPHRRWSYITIDCVVDLPKSHTVEGTPVNNIMVVVDRLTKMRHFIPCTSMKAKQVAKLFYTYVWKYHGLPDRITSDRGSQFVSHFWKTLCELLRIDHSMSTAYHPETDGQTEIVNATLEQTLRCFTNYLQDDWALWLPTAEFSANNWNSSTTGVSPFFATYGQHPRTSAEPPGLPIPPAVGGQRVETRDAQEFAQEMDEIELSLYEDMVYAQATYEQQANRRRQPAPNY